MGVVGDMSTLYGLGYKITVERRQTLHYGNELYAVQSYVHADRLSLTLTRYSDSPTVVGLYGP